MIYCSFTRHFIAILSTVCPDYLVKVVITNVVLNLHEIKCEFHLSVSHLPFRR